MIRENVGVFTACIKGVTGGTDNTEVLSDFFLWTFAVKTFPQEFQATETSGKRKICCWWRRIRLGNTE